MKKSILRVTFVAFVSLIMTPAAFALRKVTVQELSSMLDGLYAAKKNDEQISGELKQIEMREELTAPVLNSYTKFKPGPLTIEQLTILQYASELQPPTVSPEPDKPAPDPATQKTILEKMNGYIATVVAHIPDITVSKGTARFSDAPLSQVQDFRVSQGNGTLMGGTVRNVTGNAIRFHGITRVAMQNVDGVEKPITGKAGPANDPQGLIEWGQFGPMLRTVTSEGANNVTLTWAHWDRINTIEVAVFDFSVDRKNSHYDLSYCCFPTYDLTGGHIGPSQTITDWKPFRTTTAYHGQLYVEPSTGYILRLILQADPKTTDFIHQETTRVDYATQQLEGKRYLLPKTVVTLNNVVISGEGEGQSYTEVHSILATEYSEYKLRAK